MLAALCLYGWGHLGAEGALNACRLISEYIFLERSPEGQRKLRRGDLPVARVTYRRAPTYRGLVDRRAALGRLHRTCSGGGYWSRLLVPRFRTPAITVALSMHAFILFCLGP